MLQIGLQVTDGVQTGGGVSQPVVCNDQIDAMLVLACCFPQHLNDVLYRPSRKNRIAQHRKQLAHGVEHIGFVVDGCPSCAQAW